MIVTIAIDKKTLDEAEIRHAFKDSDPLHVAIVDVLLARLSSVDRALEYDLRTPRRRRTVVADKHAGVESTEGSMTELEIRARCASLRDVLNETVTAVVDVYPPDYHTPKYAGCWYAYLKLPYVETLGYDQICKIVEHLGTTLVNFQSATEQGYYGEVDHIVRLYVCWLKDPA